MSSQPHHRLCPCLRRLVALVDDGPLADLDKTPLKVLLVFLRHADADGLAFPSTDRIARVLGLGRRTVERAIAGLAADGLLTTVRPGRGRGRATLRRVTFPTQTPAPTAGVPGAPKPGHGHRPFAGNPGAPRPETPVCRAGPRDDEEVDDDIIREADGPGGPAAEALVPELRWAGVRGQRVYELARLPGLHPAHVRLRRLKVSPGWLNQAVGLIQDLRENRLPPDLTPREVRTLYRAGHLARLGEHEVRGDPLTFNDRGVYLKAARIAGTSIPLAAVGLVDVSDAPPPPRRSDAAACAHRMGARR